MARIRGEIKVGAGQRVRRVHWSHRDNQLHANRVELCVFLDCAASSRRRARDVGQRGHFMAVVRVQPVHAASNRRPERVLDERECDANARQFREPGHVKPWDQQCFLQTDRAISREKGLTVVNDCCTSLRACLKTQNSTNKISIFVCTM